MRAERLEYTQIAPGGAKAFGAVYGYVLQSGLADELVALVYLRVSQLNRSAYWVDISARDLSRLNVPSAKLALVQAWQKGGNLFTETERAALAWAETVTLVRETGVPDSAYRAAQAAFSEKELVDLTIAIGLMNAYNRIATSFRNIPSTTVKSQERFTACPDGEANVRGGRK